MIVGLSDIEGVTLRANSDNLRWQASHPDVMSLLAFTAST